MLCENVFFKDKQLKHRKKKRQNESTMAPRKSAPCWLFRHVANPGSRPAYIFLTEIDADFGLSHLDIRQDTTGYDRIQSWQSKGKVQCNSRLNRITYIYIHTWYIAEFLILFSLLPTSGFPFGHILSLRVALMIGRVWILGIAPCHSKCPYGLKFDQSCTHSHNTCLICLDSVLMCRKLDHKIHNIWLFFLTVDSNDSIVLPGPVALSTLRPSVLLAGECPSLQLQRLSGLVQGSKAPRVRGEFYGFYDVLRSTCT